MTIAHTQLFTVLFNVLVTIYVLEHLPTSTEVPIYIIVQLTLQWPSQLFIAMSIYN